MLKYWHTVSNKEVISKWQNHYTELISVTSIFVTGFTGSTLRKSPLLSAPSLRSWRDATILSTDTGDEGIECPEPPALAKWRIAKPLWPRHVILVGLMSLSAKAALRSLTRTYGAILPTLRLNSIAGRCWGRNRRRSFSVSFPGTLFKKKR